MSITTNETHWDDLISVLSQEIEHYSNLYEILKNKEKALIAGNVKKMQDFTRKEENYIEKIENIETIRIQTVKRCLDNIQQKMLQNGKEKISFAADNQYQKLLPLLNTGQNISLHSLFQLCPEIKKEKLEKTSFDFMEVVNKIASINRSNAELINESLDFIAFNIKLLSSLYKRETVYENTGRMKSQDFNPRSILNKQA